MRIISLSFIFAGINIAYQGIFQALDGGLESLIISVLRQFLFVLPVAWGFSILARRSENMIWTVWLTFIIAETLSFVVATILMKKIDRKVISGLDPAKNYALYLNSSILGYKACIKIIKDLF